MGWLKIGACDDCPAFVNIGKTPYCTNRRCFKGKSQLFVTCELERTSKKYGIPIAQPGEKVVVLDLSYDTTARALAELGRIVGEQTDLISVTVMPQCSQILFHLTNIDLVSQSATTKAVVDTQLMLKACKAASVFAREAANIARLTIVPGNELTPGHITVGATSAETGDNAGDLDANITGNPIEIAFNVKYLIDVLSVVDSHLITLETDTASSPGVIRPVGDDAITHVIMPMHVGGRSTINV